MLSSGYIWIPTEFEGVWVLSCELVHWVPALSIWIYSYSKRFSSISCNITQSSNGYIVCNAVMVLQLNTLAKIVGKKWETIFILIGNSFWGPLLFLMCNQSYCFNQYQLSVCSFFILFIHRYTTKRQRRVWKCLIITWCNTTE